MTKDASSPHQTAQKVHKVPLRASSLGARAAIGAIRVYQWTFSPLFATFGWRCRHLPTCSHYGCAAYRDHGFWRGSWLTLSRLVRCGPFGTAGFDPVPENLASEGWKVWRYGRWTGAHMADNHAAKTPKQP